MVDFTDKNSSNTRAIIMASFGALISVCQLTKGN